MLALGISHIPPSALRGAVTIGNFDGVHRGHRELINHLRKMAAEVKGPAVVLTFDPPPVQLLRPDSVPPALTWMERRTTLLKELGVDHVVVCETSKELLSLTAEAFFQRILINQLHCKAIVEGPNFRFGKDRGGDVIILAKLCSKNRVHAKIIDKQIEGKDWISSSRIRTLIGEGNIAEANQLLIAPYRIIGTVAHGAARGRQIGFPTANLEQIPVLTPPQGVYAGRAFLKSDMSATQNCYAAAVHIGPNPTFGEHATKVEVHLLDFTGDIYDQRLEVELLDKIRDVVKFDSLDDLKNQLNKDIMRTRELQKPGS